MYLFFFNLTFAQFAALLGSVSAVVVALYLLDRSRRKQTVATLRFWVAAEQPTVVARRKKIQQPLSCCCSSSASACCCWPSRNCGWDRRARRRSTTC